MLPVVHNDDKNIMLRPTKSYKNTDTWITTPNTKMQKKNVKDKKHTKYPATANNKQQHFMQALQLHSIQSVSSNAAISKQH